MKHIKMNDENNGVAMTSDITPLFSNLIHHVTGMVRTTNVAMAVVMTSHITAWFSYTPSQDTGMVRTVAVAMTVVKNSHR